MLKPIKFDFKYGKNNIKLETGIMARQSTSSVMASMDDTVVFVTIVCNREVKKDQRFFPLSVYYQEKFYSVGKIPGSFFRREGRSSDMEIIISRLIDRPIRPLIKSNFLCEIQIVVSVLSLDPNVNTDIISIIGVSAALCISGIPFYGPLGICRIGYINNKFILNPSFNEIKKSVLNLIIAGTKDGILMIDGCCDNLDENIILDAIDFGYKNFKNLIKNINFFTNKYYLKNNFSCNIDKCFSFLSNDLENFIIDFCKNDLIKAYSIINKIDRLKKIEDIKKNLFLVLNENKEDFYDYFVLKKFLDIERDIIFNKIKKTGYRIDNRCCNDIRDIDINVNFLPKRVHGSSLFTRGETQALVTVTLGTSKDAQIFDDIFLGERLDKFIFHYNFPPYSVGEVGNIGILKRREIGHGYLSKKGIIPIIPDYVSFPYTIRIVSEIMESNGSSSMASVCGASLALMDAGVPVKYHVAGIAMGLIKKKNDIFILSDIIGDEDKLGDMDLKIIGTYKGITALQMDIKIKGIDLNLIKKCFFRAKKSRFFILKKMYKKINKYRNNLSPFAPKIHEIKIDINQIRNVIGKGGSVIKKLTLDNDCLIEVEDSGIIKIISKNKNNIVNVIKEINKITSRVELGSIYLAKILKIVDFGIFVSFLGNKEGLVHISQLSFNNIKSIFTYFKVGQYISVRVLSIDRNGKIRLSMNNISKK